MALRKSQLYTSLWQSCDELRGGMDASQYKDYVLTLLFMKYVSDKHASRPDALILVPKGGGFADITQLKGNKEIGDKINKIIGRLAKVNDLKGVIDQADFNDESKLGTGKEMQDRLSKLVAIFDGLDFRANRAEGDDLLGDAYEYLMRHFATESGKSKGQFYTPSEVSRIMAQVVGIGAGTRRDQTIYDPTCGSGSLLLKAAAEAPHGITIYGQEMDNATWALARMNMILHDDPTAVLWRGNTLAAPYFKNENGNLKTFDFAVANPPFSAKAWSNGLNPEHDEFGRFAFGIPPTKNGDYAFLLHFIASLKSKGKGAIILPHGVLFRGNREAAIRKKLIQQGVIKGVIGLPPNLFYGTGIPACIIVLDKENAQARSGIFMIDASKGFLKDGNKNRLRSQDIHQIVDVFSHQRAVLRYARMVSFAEITSQGNDYNLNIPRYIDSSKQEDIHDLDAHLNGGIPDRDLDSLDAYWQVFPSMRQVLFAGNGRMGYSEPRVETQQMKATILGHREFQAYADCVSATFNAWRENHLQLLWGLQVNASTRNVIEVLSEDLLARFSELPLLSAYDVYQRLLDYWDEVMQDDVYLIAAAGWTEAAQPRGIIEDREKKFRETPDLTIQGRKFKMDLVPPALIVALYFDTEQAAIESLQIRKDTVSRELEEFVEELTVEDGLLENAINDKGKVTKAGVYERLKTIRDDDEPESKAPGDAFLRCLALMEAESKALRAVKEAQAALDQRILSLYTTLTEDEIKTLVVHDKWLNNIQNTINDEMERLAQHVAGRVKELAERYARPMSKIEREVEEYSLKVVEHLKRMGAVRK